MGGKPIHFASSPTHSPLLQLEHWHCEPHFFPFWKHSQYFLEHPDFRHLQPVFKQGCAFLRIFLLRHSRQLHSSPQVWPLRKHQQYLASQYDLTQPHFKLFFSMLLSRRLYIFPLSKSERPYLNRSNQCNLGCISYRPGSFSPESWSGFPPIPSLPAPSTCLRFIFSSKQESSTHWSSSFAYLNLRRQFYNSNQMYLTLSIFSSSSPFQLPWLQPQLPQFRSGSTKLDLHEQNQ